MNLADAIRQAAQSSGTPLAQPELRVVQPEPQQEAAPIMSDPNSNHHEHHEAPAPVQGNVVRLELVLSPEQLSGLFKAVVANQHSVMTLREAAQHLRVSSHALEALAQEGSVPAMSIDGKWRFTREGLDDWMSAHPKRKEA